MVLLFLKDAMYTKDVNSVTPGLSEEQGLQNGNFLHAKLMFSQTFSTLLKLARTSGPLILSFSSESIKHTVMKR